MDIVAAETSFWTQFPIGTKPTWSAVCHAIDRIIRNQMSISDNLQSAMSTVEPPDRAWFDMALEIRSLPGYVHRRTSRSSWAAKSICVAAMYPCFFMATGCVYLAIVLSYCRAWAVAAIFLVVLVLYRLVIVVM
jgi:hypothetical protein